MPSDGAIYVDGEQKVNYISTREALRILDGFGNNSASVMIGKSDYILIYDASRKLIIDGITKNRRIRFEKVISS